MTVILKQAYDKLVSKNYHTQKEKNIIKTHRFSVKNNIKIIYSNIDFLKIKLEKEKNKVLIDIENMLVDTYISQDIYELKISEIRNKYFLFDKFFIVFSGLVYGNQKKIYDIYDIEKNKLGQIVLKNPVRNKNNKNIIDSLEFSGLFFKCYSSYLDQFFQFFKISKQKNDLVKRLDYCIDIKGLEVFELIKSIKPLYRKTKNVNGLSATDIKALASNSTNIKYGKQEIYVNYMSAHNDLKIYDKILDILQNYKNRKVDGKNPYQSYLDSDNPIARIELKKKKFQNMKNNSINWVLDNIEALFFDYLLRYFEIDFSLYVGKDINLNGKENFLAKETKQKSLYHAMIMASAYLNTIEDFTGEKGVSKFLFDKFPHLENTKSIDLLDDFAVSDYFSGITENIEIPKLPF